MGIEELSKAARAAGYAMATSEDLLTSSTSVSRAGNYPWRAAYHQAEPRPIISRISPPAVTGDWRRSVYDLFGWGATA